MSLEKENSEALSSKAAAFSIANLLTEDSKRLPGTPEMSCSARRQASSEELKVREHYMNTTIPRAGTNEELRKNNTPEHCQNNGDYTIKKILEQSPNKFADQTKSKCYTKSSLSGPSAMDPLQQFAACCDLVRNIDILRSNIAFKSDPRLSHVHREVQVALQQSELWWKFYACGTEMVITRTGRRMFPTLTLSFLGMDPRKYYSLHVDLVPVDGYNYTFANNSWQVSAMASEMHHLAFIQSYQADESVHTGLYWMKNGVDFKKIRLTNRRTGSFKDGELHLSPNRKYQPRIHVVEETEEGTKVSCSTYVFPETAFVAVTTYQNEELIQLKIDHNPFAKGFRDKGARRRFIPYEQRPHGQPVSHT